MEGTKNGSRNNRVDKVGNDIDYKTEERFEVKKTRR